LSGYKNKEVDISALVRDDTGFSDLEIEVIGKNVSKIPILQKNQYIFQKFNMSDDEPGKYLVKIKAVDKSGQAVEKVKEFDLPDRPPVIKDLGISFGGQYNKNLKITSNVSDDSNMSVLRIELMGERNEILEELTNTSKNVKIEKEFNLTRYKPGKYLLRITAIDGKGQLAQKIVDVNLPNAPPQFNSTGVDVAVDDATIYFDAEDIDGVISEAHIDINRITKGSGGSSFVYGETIRNIDNDNTFQYNHTCKSLKPGHYEVSISVFDEKGAETKKVIPFDVPLTIDSAKWSVAIPSWGKAIEDVLKHKEANYIPSTVELFLDENGNISHNYVNSEGQVVNGDVNESVFGKPYMQLLQNIYKGEWNTSIVQNLLDKDNVSLKNELDKVDKGGVVIDLEGITLEQKQDYHNFLKRANDSYDGKLWVALPAKVKIGGDWNELSKGLDYKKIAENVDGIVYMTMDENPANKDIPVASPEFVNQSIDNLIAEGVPAEKIIPVIPTYIKFTASDMNGNPIYGTPTDVARNLPISDTWFYALQITKLNDTTGEFEGTIKYWENNQETDGKIKGWFPSKGYVNDLISIAKAKGVQKFYVWSGDMPDSTHDALEERLG
jgi:hypothetical protein